MPKPIIIDHLFAFWAWCECVKHGKKWSEGDEFERFGGEACEECCNATKHD